MLLDNIDQPARRWLQGWETITLLSPAKLRVQITGSPDGDILHEGPPTGKQWIVKIRVEITETPEA